MHADLPPRHRFSRLLSTAIAVVLVVAVGVLGGGIEPASAVAGPTVRGELLGERSLPPSGGTITERVTY
ncbi:MAG: hypothetical protein ABWY37_09040, partial [Microbacterium pygmaeum]